MIVTEPVGDQIGDGRDLQTVALGKRHQIGPRHGAIVIHDLANHAGRIESGEPREIDGGFGVAGTHSTPPSLATSGNTWPGVVMSR